MYASQLWCNFRKAYIQKLRVAYNFGCRALYNLPITLGAGLYATCRGERVLVVIRFNVTFLPSRSCWEKMCTCFLNDSENLATYGCALWCSYIVYICPYSLNNTTAFYYFVTECSDVAVFFRLRACACHNTFVLHLALTRVGLSVLLWMYSSIVPSVTG